MAVSLSGPLSRKLALRRGASPIDDRFRWSPPPMHVVDALSMVEVPPRSGTGPVETRSVKVADVIAEVCREFEISRRVMLSKDRRLAIVRVRHIAMWVARRVTRRSLPELGRLFGACDHTTVLNAIRRVDELAARDPELRAHLEEIAARFTIH